MNNTFIELIGIGEGLIAFAAASILYVALQHLNQLIATFFALLLFLYVFYILPDLPPPEPGTMHSTLDFDQACIRLIDEIEHSTVESRYRTPTHFVENLERRPGGKARRYVVIRNDNEGDLVLAEYVAGYVESGPLRYFRNTIYSCSGRRSTYSKYEVSIEKKFYFDIDDGMRTNEINKYQSKYK